MWSKVPIVGWLIGFVIAVVMAIPFYFLWNGLIPTYFSWLPAVWMHIPFWDCVWLAMLISIVKHILFAGLFVNSNEVNNK
jgi:hypothetical protein